MEHSPWCLTHGPLSSEGGGGGNTVGELGAGNEYQFWAVLIASTGGADHTCRASPHGWAVCTSLRVLVHVSQTWITALITGETFTKVSRLKRKKKWISSVFEDLCAKARGVKAHAALTAGCLVTERAL